MWGAIWTILSFAVLAGVAWYLIRAIQESYEKQIADIRSENQAGVEDLKDLIIKRDKEITKLTLENITLTDENDIFKEKINTLEQKYEIKTSMCLGLQKNARLWHESYEELESNIDEVKTRCSDLIRSKEIEHQKEIEDLTKYYKEKLDSHRVNCNVTLEESENVN